MGRNPIKVCVRTRPTPFFAADEILIDDDLHGITVNQTLPDDGSPLHNRNTCFHFPVHQVLHNVGQETVYESYCHDVVQGVIDGINGTILTYGQTGSGKTFTMIGDTSNYVHRGIAPRALAQIFREVAARTQVVFKVTVTYQEIYNERIYDLIDDVEAKEHRADFTIVEDRGGRGIHARGLTEHTITSEEQALNLLFSGELRRTTAQHKLNRKSNRSHSLFSIYLTQRAKTGVNERLLTSKLNLVDLAGSERLKKTMDSNDPTRPYDETIKKEAMCINQSLSYLEQCVVALMRRGGAHVPYRQCKLTNLLKDSIGGNCCTLLLACIWGEATQLEETTSTLRFAARMTKVQNQTKAIEVLDTAQLVRKQEKLIRELKQELLMHNALAEKTDQVVYDPYTPEQRSEVRRLCDRYLRASADEEDDVLVFQSVRQMREMCRQFKAIVHDLLLAAQANNNNAAQNHGGASLSTNGAGSQAPGSVASLLSAPGDGGVGSLLGGGAEVGEEEGGHGFVLGRAQDHARPNSNHDTRSGLDRTQQSNKAAVAESKHPPTLRIDAPSDKDKEGSPLLNLAKTQPVVAPAALFASPLSPLGNPPMLSPGGKGFVTSDSKETAYQMFREGPGNWIYSQLLEAKARLKEDRGLAKKLSNAINSAKKQIDLLHEQLEMKRQARESGEDGSVALEEDVVDEEEFELLTRAKDAKKRYRRDFEEFKQIKEEMEILEADLEDMRATLYQDFDVWYSDVKRAAAKASGDDSALDKLDTNEQFERMEVDKVVGKDPEALAYFQAQKTMRATKAQSSSTLKHQHKSKRFPNPR